ncbi:TonB-linked SusC/RagA family outer membrane protein [Flavobacterium sp. PL11]|uniref:SusC/RagA family TonB-linked outer membrane protein n=1 Tax=Flavobacterium sp. PL11 TaxID=3071717 RepID=UPI002E06BC34|nr:TonB-linked SusC/RagA family outer membrane protein [Flavobacterium sp. PL11]
MKFSNLIVLFFIISSVLCYSQGKRKINGIIIDKKTKEPLEQAYILIEKKAIGSVANQEGKFEYTISDANIDEVVLIVSYIGYKTKKIKVGKLSFFKIELEEESAFLNEVVVTSSYGTKKMREEVVGSIQQITNAELQTSQSVESFDKMLDGVATGVLISGSSTTGTPVKIDIRGQGSLTSLNNNLVGSSTQPLIIIDGVLLTEEAGFDNEIFDGSGLLSERFSNPLSKISPEDIESLSILKDAAAVGLYGSDAANGVIIITTKRSKSSKLSINFSTQTGFSNPINQIKYLTGPQYHELYKSYLISQGQNENQAFLGAGSPTTNTNWFDLLNRTGNFQRYNFDIGKKIKNWNVRTSFNVLLNNESQLANSYNRYAGNLNVGYTKEKLSIQFVVSPSIISKTAPNTLYSFPLPPNIAQIDGNGDYSLLGYAGFGNPLAVANQNTDKTKNIGVVGSINTSFKINKNFKIVSIFGLDYGDKVQNRYTSGDNESGWFNGTFTQVDGNGNTITYPNRGRRLDSFRQSLRWNQSNQIVFETKKENHNYDAIAGIEIQRERIDNQRQLGRGFINPGPINEAIQASSYQYNTYLSENARRSLYTQLNYNYNSKYFFLLNLRRDESSAFGSDKDVAYNGGAGLSWNISNEKFLKDVSWINFLRTRISYGVTGNSRIGPYRSLGLYNVSNIGFSGYNSGNYATPSTAPNPNLTWEKNYKFNLGIDLNILDKIQFTAEYFRDNIQDMIVSREIPLEIGYNTIQINGANMYNSGLEFSIHAKWINTQIFKWNTNFNISTLKNKITSLTGLGSTFSSSERARAQKVGSSTSAIWGVRYAGVDPATGRELFLNDDQLYDAATYRANFNPSDWEIIGNSQPDFYGGLQNNFTVYDNLSLGVRTSFRYGDKILIDNNLEGNYRVVINRNLSTNVMDRWTKQGDIATFPLVSSSNPIVTNSSRNVYDASHIKIQNINLSYKLPVNLFKAAWLKSSTVNLDVSNVAYFYKDKSARNKNGIAEYRFEYPEARTITFGFQASF